MIYYIDVGARDLSFCLWDANTADYGCIAFEPDPDEFSKIRNTESFLGFKDLVLHPYGISDKRKVEKLYITKNPGCSSLKRPIPIFDERYNRQGNFIVEKTVDTEVLTLDEAIENSNLPENTNFLLKLDVEGGELDCLNGFAENIQNLLFAQVEVNFIEYREDQCTPGDILDYFQRHNFNLIKIKDLGEYRYSGESRYLPEREPFLKKAKSGYPIYSVGVISSCDFIFLKDPDFVSDDQIGDYIETLYGAEAFDTFFYLEKSNRLNNIKDIEKIRKKFITKSRQKHIRKSLFWLPQRITIKILHLVRSLRLREAVK